MENNNEPVSLRDVLALLLQLTPAEEHIAKQYLHEVLHPAWPSKDNSLSSHGHLDEELSLIHI